MPQFPDCSTERDKVPQTPGVEKTEQIPRKTRELEFAEQSTTAERNAQREKSRGFLQRVPLKYSRE